jgi:hypothetical protein
MPGGVKKLLKRMVNCFYFLGDVHGYWEQGLSWRNAWEQAKKVMRT